MDERDKHQFHSVHGDPAQDHIHCFPCSMSLGWLPSLPFYCAELCVLTLTRAHFYSGYNK